VCGNDSFEDSHQGRSSILEQRPVSFSPKVPTNGHSQRSVEDLFQVQALKQLEIESPLQEKGQLVVG
jgi:hypothetical protein